MIRHARPFAAAALAFLAAAASAQVTVKDAWIRPTIGAATATGGYFEITSAKAAKLVGVQTPVAPSAELHEMKMDGDVMRMRAIDAIPLPAGEPVVLKPHGLHVMITGLKAPLKAGDSVPLTLVVEGADGKRERVEVKAAVR
jgi:hypothetical protein